MRMKKSDYILGRSQLRLIVGHAISLLYNAGNTNIRVMLDIFR